MAHPEFQREKENHRKQACEHRSNSDAETAQRKQEEVIPGEGWVGLGGARILPAMLDPESAVRIGPTEGARAPREPP